MTFTIFQTGSPENAVQCPRGPRACDNDIESRSCQQNNGVFLVENTTEKGRQAILLAAFGGILTIVIATVTIVGYILTSTIPLI